MFGPSLLVLIALKSMVRDYSLLCLGNHMWCVRDKCLTSYTIANIFVLFLEFYYWEGRDPPLEILRKYLLALCSELTPCVV